MHRRAKATAHQGVTGSSSMAPRAQGFTPTRYGGDQRTQPIGANIPVTTPSRFGGPLYHPSDRGVFTTPSATASRLEHLSAGTHVPAQGFQAWGVSPIPYQEA